MEFREFGPPPPPDRIKLNVDGVTKGNPGPTGGCGIFRDSSDAFLNAFTFHCDSCSALPAELRAMLHGLQLATKLDLPRLIIETDSTMVHGLKLLPYRHRLKLLPYRH